MMRVALLIVLLMCRVLSVLAAEPAPDLSPPPGARLPLAASFRDEAGYDTTIGRALNGRPAVLVFADWTCTALCGTTLGQAVMALRDTGLVPGRDYAFLAVGIDPKDSPHDAAVMKAEQIDNWPALAAASRFLTGDAPTTRQTLDAVGYHAVYLPQQDQFAHPAALLLIAPNGRVLRVLPSFMLDPVELRAGLTGETPEDSLAHRVLLICHALLHVPAGGWVPDALRASALVMLLVLGGGMLLLHRRARGRG